VLRQGDPLEELWRLRVESGAQRIFAEPDVSPYARRRDERVSRALSLNWVGSPAVLPPGTVLKPNGAPYAVFTSFSKAWKAMMGQRPGARFERPEQIDTPPGLPSCPCPAPRLCRQCAFPAGRGRSNIAWNILRAASGTTKATLIYAYASSQIARIWRTSSLSPYLRFGMISARQAVALRWRDPGCPGWRARAARRPG
jgi:deoxyribodipyrimidine photo-lyase